MKKLLLLAAVIGATAIVPRAQAGFSFGISIGHRYSPPPVYVAPPVCAPPVYVAPPVCAPRPPVCIAPAPVYYVPPPRAVYYRHHYGYRTHYRHHRYDRYQHGYYRHCD